jgi:2,3-bisphosphoglycerate-dependent phosphoglycerate mutase
VPGTDASLDPPLHDQGVGQAALLAARLAGSRLDAVYASHLKRAVQTAQPLADERGLPVLIDDELEEVRLGEWSRGEFRRLAAVRDPAWVAWSQTGRWDGIPGAEGDAVFRARVVAAIERAAAGHEGGRIAIVCHGGVIGAYLAAVLGNPRSLWLSVENTSISLVRFADGARHVVVAGDCHHLYDPVLGSVVGSVVKP